jgi:Na+/proline symporter
MSLYWTITIAAVLVGAYSVVGGLLADAVTDTIQGLAVVLGLVVLGWAVAEHMGGVSAGLAKVQPEKLDLIEPEDGVLTVLERLAVPICGTIVAVELISRFLGARSASVAAWGTSLGGAIYLVIGMIPIFLGLMGPVVLPGIEDPEQTVAKLAEVFLPGTLHIVFVGAVISAILSTVHAALHAPAAQISHNIVMRVLPDVTERRKLWSVRLTVLGLTAVAYLIAVTSHSIRELVETASAFGGAGLFVVALFALFTRYGGAASAYAGALSGLLVWAGLKYLTDSGYPYLSALLASAAAYVLVAVWQDRRLLTSR